MQLDSLAVSLEGFQAELEQLELEEIQEEILKPHIYGGVSGKISPGVRAPALLFGGNTGLSESAECHGSGMGCPHSSLPKQTPSFTTHVKLDATYLPLSPSIGERERETPRHSQT